MLITSRSTLLAPAVRGGASPSPSLHHLLSHNPRFRSVGNMGREIDRDKQREGIIFIDTICTEYRQWFVYNYMVGVLCCTHVMYCVLTIFCISSLYVVCT